MVFQNLSTLKNHFFQSLKDHYPLRQITIFFQWGAHFLHQLSPIELVLEATQTPLSKDQMETWLNLKKALLERQPIQYFFEQAYFFDLLLKVNPAVLIPRPETEELVLLAIEKIQKNQYQKILDIGTGSGCIPIALAHKIKEKITLHACDISKAALAIAQENTAKYKVNIDFFACNILEEKLNETYDLILSNPPYIPFEDQKKMDTNVLHYEPATALFVPDEDPLLFYRRILQLAQNFLKPNGMIIFEIHEDFGEKLMDLCQQMNFSGTLQKDLQEKDRFLIAIAPKDKTNYL